ncbi:hypothetical protein AALA79_17605 [Lachnospiraceae bacterium 64-25]
MPAYTISYAQIRKIAALKDHIRWEERKDSGIAKKVNKSDRIKGLFCLYYSYNKLTLSTVKKELTELEKVSILI